MKSLTVWSSLILVLILAVVGPALMGTTAQAQNPEVCFAVADNDRSDPSGNSLDQLVSLNKDTGALVAIGATGTSHIEAIAFDIDGATLYAADAGQLGTINLTTGVFTALPNPIGSGSGSAGTVNFNDVDGLSIDPDTGNLYGTQRRTGGQDDALIQINKQTGAYVPGAFGGDDYVVISGSGVLQDIDDIAIDPATGVMYAASNDGGSGGLLITVNMTTGAGAVVQDPFGADDMEGLAFFTDGQLYGSTGEYSNLTTGTENQLYTINKTTGVATSLWPFTQFTDYEALGCLTEPASVSLAGFAASGSNGIAANLGLLAGLAVLVGLTAIVIRQRGTVSVEE